MPYTTDGPGTIVCAVAQNPHQRQPDDQNKQILPRHNGNNILPCIQTVNRKVVKCTIQQCAMYTFTGIPECCLRWATGRAQHTEKHTETKRRNQPRGPTNSTNTRLGSSPAPLSQCLALPPARHAPSPRQAPPFRRSWRPAGA